MAIGCRDPNNDGMQATSHSGAVRHSAVSAETLSARAMADAVDDPRAGAVVTFSGETQYVVLHGLVRANDITPENTIASSNIAEARLEFYTEGQLTDAQKRGWFSKLYEKLRPF